MERANGIELSTFSLGSSWRGDKRSCAVLFTLANDPEAARRQTVLLKATVGLVWEGHFDKAGLKGGLEVGKAEVFDVL